MRRLEVLAMTVDYGDHLPNDQAAGRFRKWAHAVAGDLTNPYGLHYDDVVQEGVIEVWRVLELKGGKANVSARYLTQSARRRMRDVAGGRPHVGGDRRPGPRTEPPITEPLDMDHDPTGDDLLGGVEIAYHHGEIAQAINALPPAHREYVVLRFWGGMSHGEIAAHQRRTKGNAHRTWTDSIIPKLRTSLAHLEGAA